MNSLTNKYPIGGKFVLLLLMLTFFDYKGYGYVATFALIPVSLLIANFWNQVDVNFFLLLLFGTLYSVFGRVWEVSYGFNLAIITCPPILYLAGRYMVSKNSEVSIEKVLFLLALSLGSIVVYSILTAIMTSGFEGDSRNLELVSTGKVLSATGMGARMSLIIGLGGLLMIGSKIRQEKMIKIFSIALMTIALFCSFRIGTRTSTVLLCISVITAFLFNIKSYSLWQKILFLTILITLAGALFYFFDNSDNLYMTYFRDRMENEEYGFATGGGRTEGLKAVFEMIWDYPFGIPRDMTNIPYAHNLWIDAARIAGLMPLFILGIITFRFFGSFIPVLRSRGVSIYFRTFLLIISITLFAQLMVEPIIEGIPTLFFFFCLYFGIIKQIQKSVSKR